MIGRPPVIPGKILAMLDENDGELSNIFDLVYRSSLGCSYWGIYYAINRLAETKQIMIIRRGQGIPTIIRKVEQ